LFHQPFFTSIWQILPIVGCGLPSTFAVLIHQNTREMKLVSRAHKVIAMLMGLVVLAALIFQILKDGHQRQLDRIQNIQSITK